jgi:2-polyprenyl-3-methyl-5-hydroxy-6-metoxy-1,4-benzoquinol methylase
MSENKASIEQHDEGALSALDRVRRSKDWNPFYSSNSFRSLESPAEIGRFGVIAEIIFSLFSHPRVLDIGCGLGHLCKLIPLEKVESYLGVDVSDEAIKKAQQNYPGYTFLWSSVEELSITTLQHVVILSEILYYTNYMTTIDKALSFLVPDGVLIVSLFQHPAGDAVLKHLLEHKYIWKHIEIISHDAQLVWHIVVIPKSIERYVR